MPATALLLMVMVWFSPAADATAPVVTSIGTFTGSTAGGDSVTITGSNFSNVTSVKFGNNAASFTVNSTTTITATTPTATSAGVVNVTITNNLSEVGVQYGAFVYTDATHAINRWIGGTSGNLTTWTTGTNWSKGSAPVSTDIIYVNGGSYQPTFTMGAATSFYAMTVGPSTTSTVTIGGGSLTNVLTFDSDTTIGKVGKIMQTANTTTQANSIVWSVTGKLTIASGGQIFVSNGGYSSGNGPGGSATLGCSYAAYGTNGKAPYGNIKQPTDMGSGCNGSAGGGFVKVSATDLQNDGGIIASASSAASGGSIWLDITNSFSGASSGSLAATSSGAGSGGRIAVYAASSTYAGSYTANSSSGGSGTIYTNIGSQTYGSLAIDNNTTAATMYTPEMSSGNVQYDSFRVDRGGLYEIPTGTTLTLSSLPASASSSLPGGIKVGGTFNVPNATTLTNYNLVLADGTYSDLNPTIGSASSISLQKSDPNTPWSIQSLTINSGGTLTHAANTTTDTYAVNMNVSGNVTVNSGGNINVARKGYSVGNGPGKGTTGIGAGHGGYGYAANATYGNTYGSTTQPYESGSGGANSGAGGGRIKIIAQNFINNGTIAASGGGSGFTGSSGGAGGSIWIDVTSMSGSGTMDVTGGSEYGAGGGRIALYYDTNSMTKTPITYSNDTSHRGGTGTLYQKVHSHTYGSLSVVAVAGYGAYATTPLTDGTVHYESLNVGNGATLLIGSTDVLTTDTLQPSASSTYPGYIQLNGTLNVPDGTSPVNYYIYDNGTYSDQNPVIGSGTTFELQKTNSTTSWNVNTLTVSNGGTVTHAANTTAETYALNIVSTGDITINSGGSVNVLGKGYSCSNGPGAGGPAIAGYGNGGSYGGAGSRTNTSYPTVLYGSATQPTNSGSGGSCYSGTSGGGSGGGVAMLKSTGNIIVNGSVNANGSTSSNAPYGNGGSGGSIWLQANKVTGTGTLSANGGNAYSTSVGAAGGGGRIAFTYSNNLQVLSSTPNSGLITGGNSVTLSGDGFSPSTLISFGANSATVTYNNATTLTVTVPAAASNGYVDITAKDKYFNGTVTSAPGTATTYPATAGSIDPAGTYQTAVLTNGYQYAAQTPQVTSISPNYGVTAGGNTVTINGQNFMSGASVTFGGVTATNVTYVSGSQLTATVPAHAAGSVDVTVTNTDNGTTTSTNAYTYTDPPTITGVSPASGSTAGGDTVVISGTNFTSGMSVKFGTNAATNVSVTNSTTLSATTPAGTRGTADVVVSNPFTQSATLTGGFHYLSAAPTITSFTPMSGTMTGGTTVTFSGTNFDSTMKAYFNGQPGTTTGSTATSLVVKTPAGPIGDVSVSVSGPDTGSVTAASPFTYVPAAYAFTTFPSSLHQTEPGLIRIEARDTNNQPVLVSKNTDLALTSTAGTTQFSLSQNTGWGITTVTIPAGSDHVDLYVKDSVKGSPTVTATGPDNVFVSSPLTVTSRYQFLVTGISDPIDAGTPSSVTVQTTDWLGNPLNDYTGTIHFSSTDSFAQLPGDLQFTADMQGNHTFVNGVTLTTNGENTVTVTDTTDAAITGSQNNITVQNGYSGPAAKLAVITDPQRVDSNKSTSAITVQVQDTNGNPAPVPVNTTIYITTSSNTGSFRADESAAWSAGTTFQVTIPANMTAASFYYLDTTIGDVDLSMRDQVSTTDTSLTDTQQTVSIGAGTPYRLAMATQDAQLSNKWNPITITLRDDQDRQLTIGQNPPTAYLTSGNASLLFASDSVGTGATSTYSKQLTTGTNKLIVYVNSASAQQVGIHLSDAQPADGTTGLQDDDKLVNFVTQAATHISLSANASVAANDITGVTVTALNDNGDVAPVSGSKTISLSSTGAGVYSLTASPWNNVSSVVIPDGSSSISLSYRNPTAGTATLHADSPLGAADRSITVTPGAYSALAISGATNVPVDTPTQYAVSMRDIFGNQTTSSTDTTSYVYTSSPSGAYGATSAGTWDLTSVTIPAGASAQTIYYLDSALARSDTLTVSDQSALDNPDVGITNGTLAITTVGQTIDHFAFATAPQSVTAGVHSGAITVEAMTSSNQPARVGSDTLLTLTSSSAGQPAFYAGASDTNTITSVTIPAGSSQISFYYSDIKAGTYTLQALHSSGKNATQNITITAASPTDNGKLLFTTPAQTKDPGVASDAIRIATADKYGNEAVVASNTQVALGSDCGGQYSFSPTTWSPVANVTIASGSSAATVYFKSDVSCSLTATATGYTDGQQAYTVQNGPYRLVISGPTLLELNQTGTYSVSMQDINGNSVAPSQDRTLYLSGDGLQSTTNSFTFLSGQTTQTVQAQATAVKAASLSVRDESDAAAPDTGLINASASTNIQEGTPTKIGVISLTPSPSTDTLTHLSIQLQNAYGGLVSAPANTTISLTSTDATGAFHASNSFGSATITDIVLPQGASSVDVYYAQTDSGQAFIRAANASYTTGELDLTTASGAVVSYQLSADTSSAELGQTVNYTVSALDKNGNISPMHNGDSFYIDYSGGSINSSNFNPSTHLYSVTGTTTAAHFTLTAATTGTHTITISDSYPLQVPDSGITDASQSLTIIAGAPAKLAFSTPTRSVERGGVSDIITVELRNAHDAAVTSGTDTPVTLTTTSPVGSFSESTGGPWTNNIFTIPSGTSTLTVFYTDSTQPTSWQLQASASGLTSATQGVSVIGGAPVSLHFVNAPTSLVSYHDSDAITVELHNQYGYPTNKQNNDSIVLSTDAPNGEFADSQHNWQTNVIPWNSSTSVGVGPSFYYRSYTTGANHITATLPGITPAQQTVDIVPQVMTHFVVTNVSDPIQVGVPSSVVVIAKDAAGYTVPSYDGTITFSASDPTTTVPPPYTFVPPVDRGTHTFVNAVRFAESGEMTIAVYDVAHGISGEQDAITVIGKLSGASGPGQTTPTPTVISTPTGPGIISDIGGGTAAPSSSPTQSSHGTAQTNFIASALMNGLAPLGSIAGTIFNPRHAAYTAPAAVYGVFFGYTLLLAAGAVRDAKSAVLLAALLKREKKTAHDKNEFINLLSHHLRTPMTIISGVIDLAAFTQKDRDMSSLKSMSAKVQKDVEAVLATATEQVADIEYSEPRSDYAVYQSARLWGPVAAAVAATVVINVVINSNPALKSQIGAYLFQAALMIIGTIALYLTLRSRKLHMREKAELQHELNMQHELDGAKNDALHGLAHTIDSDLKKLETVLQDRSQRDLAGLDKIEIAETELADISHTARLVADAHTSASTAHTTNISNYLDTYITRKNKVVPRTIVYDASKPNGTTTAIDTRLLTGVLDTVFDNAVKYSPPDSKIMLYLTFVEDDIVIAIENQSVMPLNPNKDIDIEHPFIRREDTLTESVQGLGLSLYADRAVLASFGGTISLTAKDTVVTTTIKLPRS